VYSLKFVPYFSLDKSIQQQNRFVGDGYVKLAAESVAINPLESKKN